MAYEKQKKVDSNPEQEPNLKGTLISVSIVGVIILVSWIAVFMLYLAR